MRSSIVSKISAAFAGLLLLAACASEPETAATTTGEGGQQTAAAPATGPVPGSVEDFMVNVGDRVFFDLDKYDLKPEASAQLEQQARSEEHTSDPVTNAQLVCRLLLEKKNRIREV